MSNIFQIPLALGIGDAASDNARLSTVKSNMGNANTLISSALGSDPLNAFINISQAMSLVSMSIVSFTGIQAEDKRLEALKTICSKYKEMIGKLPIIGTLPNPISNICDQLTKV